MSAQRIRVEVAGELVIDVDDLPREALELIQAALVVINEEKEKAAMVKQWGHWELPDYIELYRTEQRRGGRRVLCLPRGFSMALGAGMTSLGLEIEWVDKRSTVFAAPGYYKQFVMRDYQLSAVVKMLRAEQGFYVAPTGSGKSVACLGMAAWANQRTLLIVDRSNLAEQWRTRAAQFFDMPMSSDGNGNLQASLDGDRTPGKIGEDVWEERDFTVALRQTLHSKGWGLDAAKFYENWGMVIADEGHHLSAETTGNIARKVTSRYFFGVSATPAGSEARAAIVHALVGPIVAETTRQELYDREVLVRPTIEVRRGSLDVAFWPDHEARFDKKTDRWKCEKPGCSVRKKHSHRNNYACHDSITETLTDQGWKTLDELKKMWSGPDKLRVAQRTESGSLVYDVPVEMHVGQYDGEMLHFEQNNGMDIMVTPNHRMLVSDFGKGPWYFRDADQVWKSYQQKIPMAAVYEGERVERFVLEPVQRRSSSPRWFSKGCDLSMDAWMKWLGWWIAEGSAERDNGVQVTQSSTGHLLAELQHDFDALGLPFTVYDDDRIWRGRIDLRQHLEIKNWIVEHCGSGSYNKRLPEMVFDLHVEQRKLLLEGMMAGDGSARWRTYETARYSTVSARLADGFQRLAISCGLKATIHDNLKVANGSTIYGVSISRKSTSCVPTARNASYSGEVYCFSMPEGTMITRRNGRACVTGNSVLKALVESPERNDAIAARIMSERGHVHLVPSRQKKHLDLIRKAIVVAGWPEEKIWMLRGEENAQGLSQQIADEVSSADEAVILSTVADEGLDIPPIDRLYLVFPLRKALGVIQTVGRVERVSPGKLDAKVVDFHEPHVSVFAGQFEERLRTFRQQGYHVVDGV